MAEHIKVPAQTPAVFYIAPTPPVGAYAVPYMFFSPTDLIVIVGGVLKTLNVDYLVVPTGGYDKGFPGGVVNFVVLPPSGTAVSITRRVPIARTVDFPPAGPLQTVSLNTELDKLIAIDQQMLGDIIGLDARIDILELGDPRLGRALLFPPEDLALNHTLPAIGARNNRVLGFRTDGEMQMFRTIVFPDGTSNEVLPPPTGRANRALAWDVTGQNLALLEVVAGAIVPDANNVEYIAFGSATPRSVADRLKERLSIKDFGPNVGEGDQAADDAALAAAINFINAAANWFTLYYPPGVYFHGPCPVALTASNVTIEGAGDNGVAIVFQGTGNWLSIGLPSAPRTEHVSVRNISFDWSLSPSQVIFLLQNTFDTNFDTIHIRNVDTFFRLGGGIGVPTSGAYKTSITNTTGYSGNHGMPLFRLTYGGGLAIGNCTFYLNGTPVAATSGLAIDAVGTNFTQVRISATRFENFDFGCHFVATSNSTISDVVATASSFENCKSWALYLSADTSCAVLGVRLVSCLVRALTWDGVVCTGSGGANDNHAFINCDFAGAGRSHFFSIVFATNIVFSNNRMGPANQAGTGTGAVECHAGTGYTILGNVGLGTVAPWGIVMRANLDSYNVSDNRVFGSTGSILVDADSVVSQARRVFNNNYTAAASNGYAGIINEGLFPSAGWFNTSPFVRDVFLTGGDFSNVFVNGIPLGAGRLDFFRVEPGDHVSLTYTTLPNFGYRSHQ